MSPLLRKGIFISIIATLGSTSLVGALVLFNQLFPTVFHAFVVVVMMALVCGSVAFRLLGGIAQDINSGTGAKLLLDYVTIAYIAFGIAWTVPLWVFHAKIDFGDFAIILGGWTAGTPLGRLLVASDQQTRSKSVR